MRLNRGWCGPTGLQEVEAKLANFKEPAGRGFPLLMPPSAEAVSTGSGATANAAVTAGAGSPDNMNILPLSLVAASGHSAGAAATFFERV